MHRQANKRGKRKVVLGAAVCMLHACPSAGYEAISTSLVIYMNHGQEVYISDIPPAVEEAYGNMPRGPYSHARGVYSHKPPNTSRWYITDWTWFISC